MTSGESIPHLCTSICHLVWQKFHAPFHTWIGYFWAVWGLFGSFCGVHKNMLICILMSSTHCIIQIQKDQNARIRKALIFPCGIRGFWIAFGQLQNARENKRKRHIDVDESPFSVWPPFVSCRVYRPKLISVELLNLTRFRCMERIFSICTQGTCNSDIIEGINFWMLDRSHIKMKSNSKSII